jgi:hypothetical protein
MKQITNQELKSLTNTEIKALTMETKEINLTKKEFKKFSAVDFWAIQKGRKQSNSRYSLLF